MDGESFDAVVQRVAEVASRRGVLRAGLGALAVTLGFAEAEATHFFCLHVGRPCKKARLCCSSRCKRGRCRAHNVGGCTAAKDICVTTLPGCGGGSCYCNLTTGGANFCSAAGGQCMDCVTDAQCAEALNTPGSACVTRNHGFCNCVNGSPTSCVPPCPS
jgi:hypothetical protein